MLLEPSFWTDWFCEAILGIFLVKTAGPNLEVEHCILILNALGKC